MNNVNYISLNDYTESPPPGVWDAVCAGLDRIEASEKKFRQLSDFEVPVDGVGIWSTLSQLLDKDEKTATPVKQMASATKTLTGHRNKTPILISRTIVYTAVAAAVLAAGIFLFIQSNKQTKNNNITVTPKPSAPEKTPSLPVMPDSSALVAEETVSDPVNTAKPAPRRITKNTAPTLS